MLKNIFKFDLKKYSEQFVYTMSEVISEVKTLTNNYTTILSLEDAIRLKLHK